MGDDKQFEVLVEELKQRREIPADRFKVIRGDDNRVYCKRLVELLRFADNPLKACLVKIEGDDQQYVFEVSGFTNETVSVSAIESKIHNLQHAQQKRDSNYKPVTGIDTAIENGVLKLRVYFRPYHDSNARNPRKRDASPRRSSRAHSVSKNAVKPPRRSSRNRRAYSEQLSTPKSISRRTPSRRLSTVAPTVAKEHSPEAMPPPPKPPQSYETYDPEEASQESYEGSEGYDDSPTPPHRPRPHSQTLPPSPPLSPPRRTQSRTLFGKLLDKLY